MKTNVFTIDTEDWFQINYGTKIISPTDWGGVIQKIDLMIEGALELLEARNVSATFFVVGWIAEKHPNLIRKILGGGHEIASHGYWHSEVSGQNPTEFSKDIKRAKACLEMAGGQEVNGFRAPNYSIGRNEEWALDLLVEAGYKYDSSLLHASKQFARLKNGLYEVAPNSLNICGRYFPSNGGFFFRISPYFLYRSYVQYLNGRDLPLVFYTHTWEIFPEYPRMDMSPRKKFIQYANLSHMGKKLNQILQDFDFTSIAKAYPMA